MKIKDIMTKNVVTIMPGTPIVEINRVFRDSHFGALPVVDKDRKILGIITMTELLSIFLPDYFEMLNGLLFIDDFGALEEELESPPVFDLFIAEDIMVKNVITISDEASLLKAPALMKKYNVKRLLVADEQNRLIGIVTRRDICHAFFKGDI